MTCPNYCFLMSVRLCWSRSHPLYLWLCSRVHAPDMERLWAWRFQSSLGSLSNGTFQFPQRHVSWVVSNKVCSVSSDSELCTFSFMMSNLISNFRFAFMWQFQLDFESQAALFMNAGTVASAPTSAFTRSPIVDDSLTLMLRIPCHWDRFEVLFLNTSVSRKSLPVSYEKGLLIIEPAFCRPADCRIMIQRT